MQDIKSIQFGLVIEIIIFLKVKTKLEKDLGQVSADYDDIARELKMADDRANKAGHDAQHYEVLLR